jgi:hypothetical protein
VARGLKPPGCRQMQSRAEHTGLSAAYRGEQGGAAGRAGSATVGGGGVEGGRRDDESRVFPFANRDGGAPHVGDMPMRQIPVIPAHLPMAGARKVAALKEIGVLLVEREEQIVGTLDENVLAAADDLTPTAAAMKPLALYLRPAMSVAQARDVFIRARTSILPVVAGGFVLGAVARSDIERTKPHASER